MVERDMCSLLVLSGIKTVQGSLDCFLWKIKFKFITPSTNGLQIIKLS